jgi:hypothetical protein
VDATGASVDMIRSTRVNGMRVSRVQPLKPAELHRAAQGSCLRKGRTGLGGARDVLKGFAADEGARGRDRSFGGHDQIDEGERDEGKQSGRSSSPSSLSSLSRERTAGPLTRRSSIEPDRPNQQ